MRRGPADPGTQWRQTAGKLREAISCGALVPGGAEYVIDRDVPAAALLRWLDSLLSRPAPVR
jgi:hypothetical protein